MRLIFGQVWKSGYWQLHAILKSQTSQESTFPAGIKGILYALLPGREGPMLLGTFAMLLLVLEEAPGLQGDSDGTYRD